MVSPFPEGILIKNKGESLARSHWHILRDETSVTVTRRLPARFDVFVETRMPLGRKLRIAHQVRQDMWRALQDLRGFAPLVQVTQIEDVLIVKAGGQFAGKFPRQYVLDKLAVLLADPEKRARWVRFSKNREAVSNG
ncbi:MAG: hypothetical protein ACRBBO_11740 [Cognatishimia sp.]